MFLKVTSKRLQKTKVIEMHFSGEHRREIYGLTSNQVLFGVRNGKEDKNKQHAHAGGWSLSVKVREREREPFISPVRHSHET